MCFQSLGDVISTKHFDIFDVVKRFVPSRNFGGERGRRIGDAKFFAWSLSSNHSKNSSPSLKQRKGRKRVFILKYLRNLTRKILSSVRRSAFLVHFCTWYILWATSWKSDHGKLIYSNRRKKRERSSNWIKHKPTNQIYRSTDTGSIRLTNSALPLPRLLLVLIPFLFRDWECVLRKKKTKRRNCRRGSV